MNLAESEIDPNSPCHYNNHIRYTRPENALDDRDILVGQWILFPGHEEDCCQQIPMTTAGRCYGVSTVYKNDSYKWVLRPNIYKWGVKHLKIEDVAHPMFSTCVWTKYPSRGKY